MYELAIHSTVDKELIEADRAVEFWYEYSERDDPASQWFRTYGIEHWVLCVHYTDGSVTLIASQC
jgi:nuclear transport factor 2 (NTF2) superfamily protein